VSDKIVQGWDTRAFKAELAGNLAAGLERALEFAATQARGKAPVRRGIMRRDIDTTPVEARGNVIEGYVGVKKGKAFYALFVELGTRLARAQPFLRPAVFGNAREIQRLVLGG
jgi:HK97 gp10 family phage protein